MTILEKPQLLMGIESYRSTAQYHSQRANMWLTIGGLFMISSIALTFTSFLGLEEQFVKFGRSELYFLLKIIAGVYAINFCIRNYRIEKHNETINLQKANSISAYLTLMEEAKTAETKDKISFHGCSTIFTANPTGFNKKQEMSLQSVLAVIKQIRKVFLK